MAGRLIGKTALITGASRGIGRSIAQAYAREGARLVLAASSLESFSGLELPNARLIAADLTQATAPDDLFQQATSASEIDVLVNNAGIYRGMPFEKYERADLEDLFEINVFALFRLTQLAVTHMKGRGGKIVQIASTAGKWESPNQSVYNMTKHAVVGMSKCVALETAQQGIQVNTICPGMVETDMFQQFQVHADIAGVSLDELKAGAVARIPQGRFLDPEEVAHIAVYLGSSESDGMTGQTITIAGGMRMG